MFEGVLHNVILVPMLMAIVVFNVSLGLLFGAISSEGFVFGVFLSIPELAQLILVKDICLECNWPGGMVRHCTPVDEIAAEEGFKQRRELCRR